MSTKKRKNRVCVTISTVSPITSREASELVDGLIKGGSGQYAVTKTTVSDFERAASQLYSDKRFARLKQRVMAALKG